MKKYLCSDSDLQISLDSQKIAEDIRQSPDEFLQRLTPYARIGIDEVQKVPELFGSLKAYVDEHQQEGKFILTGSANYRSLPNVNESLAGRLGVVNLRTLSEGEMQGSEPRFFSRILSQNYADLSTPNECSKALIVQKALVGGYPKSLTLDAEDRRYFFVEYVRALLEHDLKDVGNFRKLDNLFNLLTALASTSSKIVNDETLISLMNVDRATLRQYISALKVLYIVDEIPAWSKSSFDKISKTPKRFISDTGLLSALSGFSSSDDVFRDQLTEGDFTGKLIETWVYCQIAAHVDTCPEWQIHHFRTYSGKEIDFLLENRRGDLIAIEVKGKERVQKKDFDNINWFAENIAKERTVHKLVLYCGDIVKDFGHDCVALPMTVLWR